MSNMLHYHANDWGGGATPEEHTFFFRTVCRVVAYGGIKSKNEKKSIHVLYLLAATGMM